MAAPITPIQFVPSITQAARVNATEPSEPGVFQAVLAQSVQSAQQIQTNTQGTIDRFLAGEGEEIHHVALAAQQAEMSFDLFMQVRNKVVSAYQEIMRMQV
jgi:flagellar hook-basal body complex protein FliE